MNTSVALTEPVVRGRDQPLCQPYADGVEGVLLLSAGLLGVVVGLAAAFAFRLSEREQRGASPPLPQTPPADLESGVAMVLAVLPSTAVVTGLDGEVIRATASAHAHGLVRDGRVTHPEVRELLRLVARDGEIRDVELELPRGPFVRSVAIPFGVRVAPLGATHLLLLAEDLTQARRLDAVRRDFVVNASHELKTPVGALSLLAETVAEAADDPEVVRRFTGRIQVEAQRLSALVQDILQLSRVQTGLVAADLDRVKIGDVVQDAADRARTTAEARGISLEVGGTDATVLGDHDLLVTVVRNLLDNAIAYSDRGTHVGVGVEVRPDEDVVEIAVVDQGIGIPIEAQPRIFERFYRVDPARSRDTGGTGLGLSIVKHVVADHGGEVRVWSQPGQGSTFTVRLPLAPHADPSEPVTPGVSA